MSYVMMRIIMDLTVTAAVLLVVLHPGVGSWMVDVINVIRDTTVISVTNSVVMDVKIKLVIKLTDTVNVKMNSMVGNVMTNAVLNVKIQHAIKLMVIVLSAKMDFVGIGVL